MIHGNQPEEKQQNRAKPEQPANHDVADPTQLQKNAEYETLQDTDPLEILSMPSSGSKLRSQVKGQLKEVQSTTEIDDTIKKGLHKNQQRQDKPPNRKVEGNRPRSVFGRVLSALVHNPLSRALGSLATIGFKYTVVPVSKLLWAVAGKHLVKATWMLASVPIDMLLQGNSQAQQNSSLRKGLSFLNNVVFKPVSSLALKGVSAGTSLVSKALYLSMEGWAPGRQLAAADKLSPSPVRWLAKGLFTGISLVGAGICVAGVGGALLGAAGLAVPAALPTLGAGLTYGLFYAPTLAALSVRTLAALSTNDFETAKIHRPSYEAKGVLGRFGERMRYRLCHAFDAAVSTQAAFSYQIQSEPDGRISVQKKPTSSETYQYVCAELKRRHGSEGVEGLARLALMRAEEEQHRKIEEALETNDTPEYITRSYVTDTIATALYREAELRPHPKMFYANGEMTIRAYETVSSMLHALEPDGYKDLIERSDERVIAELMNDSPENQNMFLHSLDTVVSALYTSSPSRYIRSVYRRLCGDVDRKTYLHQLVRTVGKGIYRAHGEIQDGDSDRRKARKRKEIRGLALSPRYRKRLYGRLREGVGKSLPAPGEFCEPELDGYAVPVLERKDFKPGPSQLLIASGRMIGGWPIPVIGSMLGASVSTLGYLARATGKNLITVDELGTWINVEGLRDLKLEVDAGIYGAETAGEAISNSLRVGKNVVSLCQNVVEPFSENMGRSFIEIIIANTPLVAQYQMNDMRDQVSKATFVDLEDAVNHLDPVPDYDGEHREIKARAAELMSKAEAFLKEFGDDIVADDHDSSHERTIFHYFSSIVRRPRRLMIALARAIEKAGNQTEEARDLIEGLRLYVEKSSKERFNSGFEVVQDGLDGAIAWVEEQYDMQGDKPSDSDEE